MYTEYFGLADSPFSISPDPNYLYLSDKHREALAHLIYGVGDQGGFVVLTGEVGTGKTTICRSLLQQVPDNVDVAFIINPKQSINQLLQSIFTELSVPYQHGMTSKDMIDCLNDYLLLAHANGRNTVLIIDEAQNLSTDILEQLRLLTNLETNEKKLLQLVLLGQPELNDMLSRPELRQLAQRVTARYHLSPLSKVEVSEYVQHRLSVARCNTQVFSPSAIKAIYKLSAGIPRLINLICDRSLLGVYSLNGTIANAAIVKKAAKEVFTDHKVRKPLPWSIILACIVSVCLLFSVYYFNRADQADNSRLDQSFDELPSNNNASEELSSLLNSWRLPVVAETNNRLLSCDEFVAADLYCHIGNDSLPQLLLTGRPAVIEYIKSNGQHSYLLLNAIDEGLATVVVDNKTYQFDKGWLMALNIYQSLYISRIPATLNLPITQGTEGRDVAWLLAKLSQLDDSVNPLSVQTHFQPQAMVERSKIHHLYSYRLDFPKPSQINYDASLQTIVKSLQRDYGLIDNAVVDQSFVFSLLSQLNSDDPVLLTANRGEG